MRTAITASLMILLYFRDINILRFIITSFHCIISPRLATYVVLSVGMQFILYTSWRVKLKVNFLVNLAVHLAQSACFVQPVNELRNIFWHFSPPKMNVYKVFRWVWEEEERCQVEDVRCSTYYVEVIITSLLEKFITTHIHSYVDNANVIQLSDCSWASHMSTEELKTEVKSVSQSHFERANEKTGFFDTLSI